MSLVVKQTGSDFKPAPAGTHIGICVSVIDIGTQVTPFKNEDGSQKSNHQVRLTWELPNEPMEDGRPFSVSKYYTASLHEKATLRQHLEAWRGKGFTDDELEGFHLKNVLGKPCMVSVTHKPKADKSVSAVVSGVVSIPKGTQIPNHQNDLVMFDIENWDDKVFADLTEYTQKQIMQSVEGSARAKSGAATSSHAPVGEGVDDDIPF